MNDQLPSQDLKPGSLFKPQLPPFFPQHVCMLSCFSCVQLCAGKNTREAAKTSSRVSSQLGDRTHVSCSSCIAGRFFTAEPPRKPPFPSTHPHTLRGCSGTKSQPLLPPSLTQTVPPTQTPPILCARGLNGAQVGPLPAAGAAQRTGPAKRPPPSMSRRPQAGDSLLTCLKQTSIAVTDMEKLLYVQQHSCGQMDSAEETGSGLPGLQRQLPLHLGQAHS